MFSLLPPSVLFVLTFLLQPRQRTFEDLELDFIFAVPTGRHANYQLSAWFPRVVRRYLLRQRDARLEPLYQLDDVLGDGEGTAPERFH